jgi:hypothetical protein
VRSAFINLWQQSSKSRLHGGTEDSEERDQRTPQVTICHICVHLIALCTKPCEVMPTNIACVYLCDPGCAVLAPCVSLSALRARYEWISRVPTGAQQLGFSTLCKSKGAARSASIEVSEFSQPKHSWARMGPQKAGLAVRRMYYRARTGGAP